jgi:hypothetical protein
MKLSTIAQLQHRNDLVLLTDSQDTEEYRNQYTNYDGFFVKEKDGDIIEIWGFVGIVPYLSKLVSKLK